MSRQLLGVEKGFRIYVESTNSFVDYLVGTAVPDGLGDQADAPIGSFYQRIGTAGLYVKELDNEDSGDWVLNGSGSSSGLIETPYTPANGTVTVGDTIQEAIEKLDGNQQDLITLSGVSQGAVDLGTFTGATIPDSSDIKEALQALETAHEEVDQNVNDLITLSGVAENATSLGTFTGVTIPDSSTIKAALQSLETAHEEVDQNVNDLITLSGVAENATSFGTFTGGSLADSQTAKQLFQRIETLLEQMRGVQATGITTITAVDSVPHASVKAVKWLVEVFSEGTPANRECVEVFAATDGTNVDDTVYAKLKLGSNISGLVIGVAISGANMNLNVTASSAVTATVRRIEVVKSVL
jgi:type II secretory pathway component PulM